MTKMWMTWTTEHAGWHVKFHWWGQSRCCLNGYFKVCIVQVIWLQESEKKDTRSPARMQRMLLTSPTEWPIGWESVALGIVVMSCKVKTLCHKPVLMILCVAIKLSHMKGTTRWYFTFQHIEMLLNALGHLRWHWNLPHTLFFFTSKGAEYWGKL